MIVFNLFKDSWLVMINYFDNGQMYRLMNEIKV